jgi:ubiquinone biosynthesis protein
VRADVRRRGVERAVRAMGALKGPWAKAGQFAAHRHDVLPATAASALASLRDRVPPLPLSALLPVVEADLGSPTDRFFAAIDAEPLGAASIAQAHRARLHDGTEVVVKIQYPWIGDALPADLRVLHRAGRIALRWAGARLSSADFDRFFDEFAAGLGDEIDFRAEARAAAEIAENLSTVPDVVVPVVHTALSGRRVLTMGWRPCVRIDDGPALAARGVPTGAVVATLARAYAKQVFVDGLFHADPHPGNLFVLDEPEAAERPRVLFVDFGLCRRLSPELRRAMRAGIHAVLKRDVDEFLARMDEMGMIAPGARAGVRGAVVSMFDRLAAATAGGGRGGVLGASTSSVLGLKDEAKRLLQDTPGLQLPNDLLLYARTLSYLFALGESLDPDVDLMQISIPYLLRFLAERDA